MKNKMINSLVVLLLIFASVNTAYGQDVEEKIELKKFGLGLHIEQFKLHELAMDIAIAPANKIVFTITPNNNFRLEPEIGFTQQKDKETDLKAKSTQVGIGAYGMLQKGKANFYGGLKLEHASISSEYIHWDTDFKETEKLKRLAVGPVVGVEYFFGEHFSFGGEVGLKFMDIESTDSQYNEDVNSNVSYVTTESGLLVRFYF
ncbi:porin family protein [Labilibacter sediminis]|nr:porin family protein [Labilibacter sediminis]